MRRFIYLIIAIFMLVFAASAAAQSNATRIDGEQLSIILDTGQGAFSVVRSSGEPVILNARSEIIGVKAGRISTANMQVESSEIIEVENALGKGRALVVQYVEPQKGAHLEQKITLYNEPEFVTVQLSLLTDKPMKIRRIFPVAARFDEGGGLFAGREASATQVLENGGSIHDMPILDFYIDIKDGNEISTSNWSACVYDRATDSAYVSGFLTNRQGLTTIKTVGGGGGVVQDGRTAFNTYEAVTLYTPSRPMKKETPLVSEVFFIDAVTGNVFEALENFAQTATRWVGKKLWSGPVPMGWNSWGGGYGSGGMGTNITEDIILENLDAAAADFKKYGLKFFQIDDGYEIVEGEWEANEKFPHGMKWLADRIREKGFRPGIWINAFLSTREATIWKEHPDWFAKKSTIGKIVVPENWEIIDFSNPGAQQWLRDLFTKVTKEWGFEWIKLDFAYWSLCGEGHYDSSKTAAEIYEDALEIVRETIGPDVHLLTVSIAPINFEYADSIRITLDNEPWWNPSDDGPGAAGVKPTVLSFMRRYYLHGNAFINHDDLIFFRESSDRDQRVGLTMNETRAFVSTVGLSGSIVKLGEPWVDMKPEWVYTMSRIMPPYGKAARPLDMFEHEWAQVWRLPVTTPAGSIHYMVGLFNWGLNENLVTHDDMPEEPREIGVDLAALGLDGTWLAYDFWDREFLGEVEDGISKMLDPRMHAVIGLFKKTGAPQFIGSSRHITMGGTDLLAEKWDAGTGTLTLTFSGTELEPYEIAAYLPDGWSLEKVTGSDNLVPVPAPYDPRWSHEKVTGSDNLEDVKSAQSGNVVKIAFTTTDADDITLNIECVEK